MKDDRFYFYKPYGVEECKGKIYRQEQKRVIPGTQFSILIPLIPFQKIQPVGLGQFNTGKNINEGYDSFAEYLVYEEKKIEYSVMPKDITDCLENEEYVYSAEKKLGVVRRFADIWRKLLMECTSNNVGSEKKLYFIDMSSFEKKLYFQSSDNAEVFIKGFFEAVDSIENRPGLFAFTNVDHLCMQVFKDICIAFAGRKFPENLQLYICNKNCINSMILFGDTFYEAIHNGYLLAIEHGTYELGVIEYSMTKELFCKINDLLPLSQRDERKVNVAPFDVILSCDGKGGEKIFERQLAIMADEDIDGEKAGYKIGQTHMRLGNKVHILSFYEMSFLFYRTTIANRVAFEILQDIYSKRNFTKINIEDDRIVFYGYASYSKAILTSLVEILKKYGSSSACVN